MSQLDYNDMSDVPAVKGGLADIALSDKVGRVAAADIGFGVGLMQTAVAGFAAIPTATGFNFEGISVQTNKPTPNDTGIALYEAGEEITVLRKGRIWVYVEEAVAVNDDVFLRHTTNAALLAGDFRTDADTARADQITNARFITATTAAGLAMVEINLP